jgi:hypothetical protein
MRASSLLSPGVASSGHRFAFCTGWSRRRGKEVRLCVSTEESAAGVKRVLVAGAYGRPSSASMPAGRKVRGRRYFQPVT